MKISTKGEESMKKVKTHGPQETQDIALKLSKKILLKKPKKSAVVLALQGDLGAGKTTFVQGFALGLGIQEKVLSPTFILMRRFDIDSFIFKNFYHIDCYRLENEKDLEVLGFKEILNNPENIIAIEWPEKISNILPQKVIEIKFKHLIENKRTLTINE